MHQEHKKYSLGVIGGGFMAHAIVSGAVSSRFLMPEQIVVSDPDAEKRKTFQALGVSTQTDNKTVAQNCNFLLLAVKPQTFPLVARELEGIVLRNVLSIMAGKTKAGIHRSINAQSVARIMPNLPCAVKEGCSGIDASELTRPDEEFVFGLFNAVGKTVSVPEEKLNAVTGISGSGPAYVYLFLKALTEAGVAQGLTHEQAKTLALQTLRGGTAMAEQSEKTFDELIDSVCSKGGTTIEAVNSFINDDFEGSVHRAVAACVKRAEELSE